MRTGNKFLQLARTEAKSRKKELAISHCQALDIVAKELGFTNWNHLLRIMKDLTDV